PLEEAEDLLPARDDGAVLRDVDGVRREDGLVVGEIAAVVGADAFLHLRRGVGVGVGGERQGQQDEQAGQCELHGDLPESVRYSTGFRGRRDSVRAFRASCRGGRAEQRLSGSPPTPKDLWPVEGRKEGGVGIFEAELAASPREYLCCRLEPHEEREI